MTPVKYTDIVNKALSAGAVLHTHEPFIKDYTVLHCLLKKYKCSSVFEVGTHTGEGTNIICHAVPSAKVYSLDLSSEEADKSMQHPKYKDEHVGHRCEKPYFQLWGDSLQFDYHKYPCDVYFIDGEHDYRHVRYENQRIKHLKPKLIIWHDADMHPVYDAIIDTFSHDNLYTLHRVEETAIAYATINKL